MVPAQLQRISLADGRELEYAEYGTPDGVPVIFQHGFMCTHSQIGICDTAAKKHGAHIICPHRPGTMGSSSVRKITPMHTAKDTIELADRLEIGTFHSGGTSGGAAFALATTVAFPERVLNTVLLSGMGPLGHPSLHKNMPLYRRTLFRLMKAMPRLSRFYIQKKIEAVTQNTEKYYEDLRKRLPEADREILNRNNIRRALTDSFRDTATNGTRHIMQEYECYWRWGFSLEDFPKDKVLQVFHGKADRLVPLDFIRYIEQVVPQAEIHLTEGSHFATIDQLDEMFSSIH